MLYLMTSVIQNQFFSFEYVSLYGFLLDRRAGVLFAYQDKECVPKKVDMHTCDVIHTSQFLKIIELQFLHVVFGVLISKSTVLLSF
jgi:hypothetical protein